MMELEFSITDEADESIRKQIIAPLVQYNDSKTSPGMHRPLAVTLRDASGNVVGGLWGATAYGWLFTQLLVVPEFARGKGVGTRLMHLAEQEAIARGCHSAWLDTFEFQARGFYERLGYVLFGELANYPSGFSRFFLQKSLKTIEYGRLG
jgi:GNAT superfamily N-acetyltransferase